MWVFSQQPGPFLRRLLVFLAGSKELLALAIYRGEGGIRFLAFSVSAALRHDLDNNSVY